MAFIFKPALWRPDVLAGVGVTVAGGTLLELPLPIYNLGVSHSWESQTTTGPHQRGASGPYGVKENVVPLSITGALGKLENDVVYTDATMWEAFDKLRRFMQPLNHNSHFEFFIYYDTVTPTYVKYKKVRSLGLTTDNGDASFWMFPYTLSLEALDPSLYTTSPGA